LLRSGLLKRFESSVRAFALTAEKMAKAHDTFLEGLDRGVVLTAGAIEEWEQVDSDEAFLELMEREEVEPAEGYDIGRLRRDVEHDRDLLRRFAGKAFKVSIKQDPKLKRLDAELESILRQAEKRGIGRRRHAR